MTKILDEEVSFLDGEVEIFLVLEEKGRDEVTRHDGEVIFLFEGEVLAE
jgi:hypothetical protein